MSEHYLFVKTFTEKEKHIYTMYILCFGIPKKTLPVLMNRFNCLKDVQHFDAHNSNQKKEKGKKKEQNIQLTHAILQKTLKIDECILNHY